MKINVRLFGTLNQYFPDQDSLKGCCVDLHHGATIRDLIAHLGIPEAKIGVVSVDEQLVNFERKLEPGEFVRIFRPIFGG